WAGRHLGRCGAGSPRAPCPARPVPRSSRRRTRGPVSTIASASRAARLPRPTRTSTAPSTTGPERLSTDGS
ncbi:MAG: hypothetical protein AVDCRST_MAG07-523, partial [uncultured Frankineae bacterium]